MKIQGLRTQESDKFLAFWQVVQEAAKAHGAVFFLDCGEGREFSNSLMEGEDLSGWLVPEQDASEFGRNWGASPTAEAEKYVVFALWERKTSGEISVRFERF